mgnify:CR=1 FL=1
MCIHPYLLNSSRWSINRDPDVKTALMCHWGLEDDLALLVAILARHCVDCCVLAGVGAAC